MKTEKLQKVLARAGYGSRREIELWIQCGRVRVNDTLAMVGQRVHSADRIYLDNQPCKKISNSLTTRVLLYHKPEAVMTTRYDPAGRETVFAALPPLRHGKWLSVGRLDFNTSGLLLFTNNGELVQRLTHPRSGIEREYAVRVMGQVTPEIIRRLTSGVVLSDGVARFETLTDAGGEGVNHWFRVIVTEGRNRVVRRLWESQGLTVSRLKRIRFGVIRLPKSLGKGAWLELRANELTRIDKTSTK